MAKPSAISNRRVPFLPDRQIEQEAEVLLAEYGQAHGAVTEPPVPVDEMIELYLGLSLEFHDMQKLFGVGDVHGALWVNERRVGVDARAGHRPAQLSGGEQQRVAFCRALANAPRLLLADEPTGNLDPATSETVFAVLMELVRATGLAALIATHNLDLAARMDRIVRLEQGRIVAPAAA